MDEAASNTSQALALLEQWTTAFKKSDVNRIVSLHAHDAVFVGSGSTSIVNSHEGIRSYFEAVLKHAPCSSELSNWTIRQISPDAVVVVGLDRNTVLRDGASVGNDGRVTFVIAKRGVDWKIVHFHRSRMPV
jgi:uncharacterized protein (TIGR02246 family)